MHAPDTPTAQVVLLTGSDAVRRAAYALRPEFEEFVLLSPDWTDRQLRELVAAGRGVVVADRTARRSERAHATGLVERSGGSWELIRLSSPVAAATDPADTTDPGDVDGTRSEAEMTVEAPRSVRCVGAVVQDDAGRLLVVQRAHPPSQGTWSVPGGRVETAETDTAAVVREVQEETGLTVEVGPHVGTVERPGPGVVYEIHDYAARVLSGRLQAASDAADARWVSTAELLELPCAPGLVETLRAWGQLG